MNTWFTNIPKLNTTRARVILSVPLPEDDLSEVFKAVPLSRLCVHDVLFFRTKNRNLKNIFHERVITSHMGIVDGDFKLGLMGGVRECFLK